MCLLIIKLCFGDLLFLSFLIVFKIFLLLIGRFRKLYVFVMVIFGKFLLLLMILYLFIFFRKLNILLIFIVFELFLLFVLRIF